MWVSGFGLSFRVQSGAEVLGSIAFLLSQLIQVALASLGSSPETSNEPELRALSPFVFPRPSADC